ncbi:Mitogen-activated protein kinase kinase 1, partial [Durusdinium trenchii]
MGRRAAYGAPQGRSLSRKVCRRSSICCLGVFIWMQIYLQISFVLSGKERDSSRLSRRSFGSDVQLVFESSIEGYEQLLDSQGLVTDVATAAVLNAASDSVAQLSEDDEDFRVLRVLRYATFGSLDGFAGHHWFEALDSLPKIGNPVMDTAVKVLADSLLYTPCWCAAFLLV